MTQSERRLGSVGELTPERLRELAEIAEAEAETRHGSLMLELIDHINAQAEELIRLRRKLMDASDALTWMGNKVTEALHALTSEPGSENNPKGALDILYAAYRRYHDDLKGQVTDGA